MGVWAEPFTTLRLQKIFNLMQDPFERADFTSNTYWDWNINHVGQIYGVMQEVFAFVGSFKDFPPRSSPPSFNPANIMEEYLKANKAIKMLEEQFPMLQHEAQKSSAPPTTGGKKKEIAIRLANQFVKEESSSVYRNASR